jgi:hypothetical protein
MQSAKNDMEGKKMNVAEYFAIEKIGYGKKVLYAIKKVKRSFGDAEVLPVPGIGRTTFRELDKAQQHAANCRLEIAKVGDFFEII